MRPLLSALAECCHSWSRLVRIDLVRGKVEPYPPLPLPLLAGKNDLGCLAGIQTCRDDGNENGAAEVR